MRGVVLRRHRDVLGQRAERRGDQRQREEHGLDHGDTPFFRWARIAARAKPPIRPEMLEEGVERHEAVMPLLGPEIVGDQHGDRGQHRERPGCQPDQPAGNQEQRAGDLDDDRKRGP